MKLSDLVNLEVEIEKQGITNYALFGDKKLLKYGRLVDWKKDVWEKGNFEAADYVKGVKIKDAKFVPTDYSKDWTESYSVLANGEWIKFTWLQLENLKKVAGVNQYGKVALPAKVKPFIDEKTINFKLIEDEAQEKIPDENVGFDSEPEITAEDLPF